MTEKNSSENRRKLLKSIAVASGAVIAGKDLPESWGRPVVDSVMLPAHAQTSNPLVFGGTSLRSSDASDFILDTLVPTANAGASLPGSDHGCATLLSNGDLEIYTQFESYSKIRMGVFKTDGTTGYLRSVEVADQCNDKDLEAYVDNFNPQSGFELVIICINRFSRLYFPLTDECTTSSWPDLVACDK